MHATTFSVLFRPTYPTPTRGKMLRLVSADMNKKSELMLMGRATASA